jgi:transcriptional regulator with XRE-family HTH domain
MTNLRAIRDIILSIALISPGDLVRGTAQKARARRLAANLSQEGLAARAGMSLGSLKRFERTGQIAFGSLVRLAFALGAEVEFDTLFPRAKFTSVDDVLRQPRTRKRGTVK